MITSPALKIIQSSMPPPSIEPSGETGSGFIIGSMVARAELERNEWLDK